jgi:hypothetical protein
VLHGDLLLAFAAVVVERFRKPRARIGSEPLGLCAERSRLGEFAPGAPASAP